jgi:hypothetical protein
MVTDDPAKALSLVQRGEDVVLIVSDLSVPPLGAQQGPGRLALMVGDSADPATQSAARAMDEELFSSRR